MGRQILPTGSNRAKNQGLKASNSRSSPTRAKEKPTGLNRRASGLHQRCERGTGAGVKKDPLDLT